MTKHAVIKSTKMFNFPYVVHTYVNGVCTEGKYFETLLKVRAYILANNYTTFASAL